MQTFNRWPSRSPIRLLWLFFLALSACTPLAATPTLSSEITQPPTQTFAPASSATPRPSKTPAPSPTPTPTDVILIGAGDISICGQDGDDQTAALLAQYPQALIFTAGDNSNEDGSLKQYTQCFGPSWGQFLERIRPAAGNHDYTSVDAADYFAYFGTAAGNPDAGYYSYDAGSWHIVVLNSNCNRINCNPEGPQLTWLKADLESHPNACSLAIFHHPRFTSGLTEGGALYNFWDILYQYNTEIVINGHDHDYERFAPQNPLGQADPLGIREFVVGTGGASQYGLGTRKANSEVFHSGTFGVLKLTLGEGVYQWEFLPVAGESFTDSGSGICH